jgi:predicted RNA-binding protein with PUA domain
MSTALFMGLGAVVALVVGAMSYERKARRYQSAVKLRGRKTIPQELLSELRGKGYEIKRELHTAIQNDDEVTQQWLMGLGYSQIHSAEITRYLLGDDHALKQC